MGVWQYVSHSYVPAGKFIGRKKGGIRGTAASDHHPEHAAVLLTRFVAAAA
jgi:hypothetical protein